MMTDLTIRTRLIRRLAITAIAVAIAAALTLITWGRLDAETTVPGEEALKLVLEGLRAREAAITSAAADYTLEIEENQDPDVLASRDPDLGPSVPRRVTVGYWAFDHQNFYEDSRPVYPEGTEGMSFRAFDGQQGRYYDAAGEWGQEIPASWMSGSICAQSLIGPWLHVAHAYLPSEPTQSQLLLKANATVLDDAAEINGLRCYLLEAKHGELTERWWASPERGWLMLRYERTKHSPSDGTVVGKATWEIAECAQVNGVWMPTLLTSAGEHARPDGRALWGIRHKLALSYQSVNKPLPLTAFQPTFPAGSKYLTTEGTRIAGE